MTDENKNTPRSQSDTMSFPDPTQIVEKEEQKIIATSFPDLDTMTREEIQLRFHELQVRQIEAELQNEQLRSRLEKRDNQAALFKIVTENLLDLVSLTDMEGNFTYVVKSHDILGYDTGFFIGKNVMDFVHPEDLPRVMEKFNEFVSSGHTRRVEYRYRCRDGTYIWLETTGNFFKDENDSSQKIVFSSRNITERKQAEEALRQINETLEQQVAERTALAETRARQLQALAVELIEAEERERQRIAELLHNDLQQMLASARFQLQAANVNLQNEPILTSVNEILEESIAKSRKLSHELSFPVLHHGNLYSALEWLGSQMNDQFGLTIELKDEKSPNLENTPLKVFLFRAVQELLFNIVKHAGVKSARVTLSGSNDTIAVFVADQGKGFSKDSIDSSPERPGFGLISIRERADRIGGHLKIESEPGQGSRFLLVLPVQTAPAEEPVKAGELIDTAVPKSISVVKRLRVLFADDHKVMRQGLITLISGQTDIEVAGEAANGKEAVELARHLRPDVIVMDISMPVMDGIEATRLIKSEFPEVRIVGLSMFEDEQSVKSIIHAGADAFVPKTTSSNELLKAVYGNRE